MGTVTDDIDADDTADGGFRLMDLNWNNLAFLLLIGASLAMLLTENWRVFLAGLALQYLAVFALISLQWSLGLAAVKLVAGLMSAAILGASQTQNDLRYTFRAGNSGLLFRFLTAMIVWLLVFSFAPTIGDWLPVGSDVFFQGALLAGMGLLQIALSTSKIRSVVGLLSVISGFEILYASLSDSVLVTALLAMIHLGLAFTGSFWMQFFSEEENTP